jgi:hypothetical protein
VLRWLFSWLEQRSVIVPMEFVESWEPADAKVILRPGWKARERP